jgi:hypothetical protein
VPGAKAFVRTPSRELHDFSISQGWKSMQFAWGRPGDA